MRQQQPPLPLTSFYIKEYSMASSYTYIHNCISCVLAQDCFKYLKQLKKVSSVGIDLIHIWWLLISINRISSTKEMKPITRKSNDTGKFQSCRPNTCRMVDKWKMNGSPAWLPDFVSYFGVFQMSAIPLVFGQQL